MIKLAAAVAAHPVHALLIAVLAGHVLAAGLRMLRVAVVARPRPRRLGLAA